MRSPFGRTGCTAEGPAELPGCAGARLARPRPPSQDHSIKEPSPSQHTKRWSILAQSPVLMGWSTAVAQHSMRDLA